MLVICWRRGAGYRKGAMLCVVRIAMKVPRLVTLDPDVGCQIGCRQAAMGGAILADVGR